MNRERRASGAVVLFTGFEPFGGEPTNPTAELMQRLGPEWQPPGGGTVRTLVLPVSWRRTWEELEAALERERPRAVVAWGLAAKAEAVKVERVALNADDGPEDNDGEQRSGSVIEPGGPLAVEARLPVREVVAALGAAGIPAAVSHHAGTYLCNHVLYRLARWAARGRGRVAGFVHVPRAEVVAAERLDAAARVVAREVVTVVAGGPGSPSAPRRRSVAG